MGCDFEIILATEASILLLELLICPLVQKRTSLLARCIIESIGSLLSWGDLIVHTAGVELICAVPVVSGWGDLLDQVTVAQRGKWLLELQTLIRVGGSRVWF